MRYDFLFKNAKLGFDFVAAMKENFMLLLSMKDDIQNLKASVASPSAISKEDEEAYRIAKLAIKLFNKSAMIPELAPIIAINTANDIYMLAKEKVKENNK